MNGIPFVLDPNVLAVVYASVVVIIMFGDVGLSSISFPVNCGFGGLTDEKRQTIRSFDP